MDTVAKLVPAALFSIMGISAHALALRARLDRCPSPCDARTIGRDPYRASTPTEKKRAAAKSPETDSACEPVLREPRRSAGAAVEAELVVGVGNVVLHRLFRDPEEESDFAIGFTGAN